MTDLAHDAILVDLVRRPPLIWFWQAWPVGGYTWHLCRLWPRPVRDFLQFYCSFFHGVKSSPIWKLWEHEWCTPETCSRLICQSGCLPGFLGHRIISWLQICFCHHACSLPTSPDKELHSVCWAGPRLAKLSTSPYTIHCQHIYGFVISRLLSKPKLSLCLMKGFVSFEHLGCPCRLSWVQHCMADCSWPAK